MKILKQLYELVFDAIIPAWDIWLLLISILLFVLGRSTVSYIPGSESHILSCCKLDTNELYEAEILDNKPTTSEDKCFASNSTGGQYAVKISDRLSSKHQDNNSTLNYTVAAHFIGPSIKIPIGCHSNNKVMDSHVLARCIYKMLWIERNFGLLINILATVFECMILIGKLHPSAKQVMTDWSTIVKELPKHSKENVQETKKKIQTVQGIMEDVNEEIQEINRMVTELGSIEIGWILWALTSHVVKLFVCVVMLCILGCSWWCLKFTHLCTISEYKLEKFYCILKPYESYCASLLICFVLLGVACVILLHVCWLLWGKRFGSAGYINVLIKNQTDISKDQIDKVLSLT